MPPDLPTLRALADRLAAATGADRELDAAIGLAFNPGAKIHDAMAAWGQKPPLLMLMWPAEDIDDVRLQKLPLFTNSIDAAVALCERQRGKRSAEWTLIILRKAVDMAWQRWCERPVSEEDRQYVDYLANAICLALVRALIAQQGTTP